MSKLIRYLIFVVFTVAIAMSVTVQAQILDNSGIVFHGKILNPDNTTSPTDSNATFTVEIIGKSQFIRGDGSAGTDTCVIYRETQNAPVNNGSFSITIGQGTGSFGSGPNTNGQQLASLFVNPPTDLQVGNVNYAIPAISCTSGLSNFQPEKTKTERFLNVFVNVGGANIPLGEMAIRSIPFAHQAKQIDGYGVGNILKIGSAANTTHKIMTSAQADYLINFYDAANNTVNFNNAIVNNVGTPSATQTSAAANVNYVNQQISAMVANSTVALPPGNYGAANRTLSLVVDTEGRLSQVSAADIALPANQVTFTGPARLLGKTTAGAGAGQEISIGSGLALSPTGELTATVTLPTLAGNRVVTTNNLGVMEATSCAANQVLSFDLVGNFVCQSPTIAGVTTLPDGQIWIGNAAGLAAARAITGDVSLTNAGVATVTRIQGNSVLNQLPTNGQVLSWVTANNRWEPVTPASGSVTAVSGTAPIVSSGGATPAISLNSNFAGFDITNMGNVSFQAGQYIQLTNEPAAIPAGLGAGDAGKIWLNAGVIKYWDGSAVQTLGLSGAIALGGDVDGASNANTVRRIQGQNVNAAVPTANQYMKFVSGEWRPANIAAAELPTLAADSVLTTNNLGVITPVSVLPVNRGGTGSSVALANNRLMYSSGGNIIELPTGTNGQMLSLNASLVPTWVAAPTVPAGTVTGFAVTAPITNTGTATSPNVGLASDFAGFDITNMGNISFQAGQYIQLTNEPAAIPAGLGAGDAGKIWLNAGVIKYWDGSAVQTLGLSGAIALGGDVDGASNANIVRRIQGQSVNAAVPTANQYMKFVSGEWRPSNIAAAELPTLAADSVLTTNNLGVITPVSVLPVNRGGTGSSVALANNRLMYSSGGNIIELPTGTNGQMLSLNASLVPTWGPAPSAVTSISTNNGLTGGAITTAGTIGLANINAGQILSNVTTGPGTPVGNSISAILDTVTPAPVQGSVLYRDTNLNGWRSLPPGPNGQVLISGGPGANPSWAAAAAALPGLASTQMWVGNSSGAATARAISGDWSMSNAGVATVTGLQNRLVANTAPVIGNVLAWDSVTNSWIPDLHIKEQTDWGNVSMGTGSHTSNSGVENTAIGALSLSNSTTGSRNTGVGFASLRSITTGGGNTAIGSSALLNTTTGLRNVAVGGNALNFVNGNDNIGIGAEAGNLQAITGSNNILIGTIVGPNIGPAASNQLNIGNWIYGHNGNIGIGQTNPAARLDVNGQIRITGGTPGNGRVLTSDATGLATWQVPAAGGSVTSITANNGLSGGTITTSGTIGLATIAANRVLGTTAAGVPTEQSLTTMFDTIGNAQGSMLYRDTNLNGWRALAPGAANQVLISGGPAANPSWATASSIVSSGNGFVNGGNSGLTSPTLGINDNNNFLIQQGIAAGNTLTLGRNPIAGLPTPQIVIGSNINLNGNVVIPANGDVTMGANGDLTMNSNGDITMGVNGDIFMGANGDIIMGSGGDISAGGQITNGFFVNTGATACTIDWNRGNTQETDCTCASAITMSNLNQGGTYTLVVTSSTTNQCNFTHTPTAQTFKFRPANAARTGGAGNHTVYTFMKIGPTNTYVSWASDFN